MISYFMPVALIVISNTFYQICAKSVPDGMNPFASLVITYAVGAAVSLVLYLLTGRDAGIAAQLEKLNWAPFVLGICIVGLEAGYIYAFNAGWAVSSAQMIASTILSIILIFVGYVLYHEPVTWNKIAGIAVCLCGLGLISLH